MLGRTEKISDACLICSDLERSIAFYRDKLGFKLRRKADGFADFASEGVVLALWEAQHIARHVGISDAKHERLSHKVMMAIEVESAERVDTLHAELDSAGVELHGAPRSYPWNAYAFYFADPDSNLWEVYAWVGDPDGYHQTFDQED
jgi:catechol 2,3-dioxygenase-like lactoylglutathione lyase family enzyme